MPRPARDRHTVCVCSCCQGPDDQRLDAGYRGAGSGGGVRIANVHHAEPCLPAARSARRSPARSHAPDADERARSRAQDGDPPQRVRTPGTVVPGPVMSAGTEGAPTTRVDPGVLPARRRTWDRSEAQGDTAWTTTVGRCMCAHCPPNGLKVGSADVVAEVQAHVTFARSWFALSPMTRPAGQSAPRRLTARPLVRPGTPQRAESLSRTRERRQDDCQSSHRPMGPLVYRSASGVLAWMALMARSSRMPGGSSSTAPRNA
jgi:hypothetical protein